MLTKGKANFPENDHKARRVKICLLGASFDTGNLGVSALAESSIKVILCRWPDAEITLIGCGYTPRQDQISAMGREMCIKTLPIRFSKNIFLPYHFLMFMLYGLLVKMLPRLWLKEALANRSKYFKILFEADLVLDVTGGDSFSDVYGFRRFFLGFMRKWLIIFLGKKLVLLPQTYGPFKKRLSRLMTRYILRRADIVYSRDKNGIEIVKNLLNKHCVSGQVRFAPDVAFVLDAQKPENINLGSFYKAVTEHSIVVGLNISGLLFNRNYTQDNMFGLRTDYRKSIYKFLMKEAFYIQQDRQYRSREVS